MKTVDDILKAKGHEVASVLPQAKVLKALELMAEKNIGAVLVIDAQGAVQGIFSERDFARKIIVKGHSCENEDVEAVMTRDVIFVQPETSLEECMNLMTHRRIRHLPVIEKGKVVGIVSIGDVVKALLEAKDRIISEQAFELGQVERARQPGVV
jgi:CBS domain-containing protein